VSTTYNPNITTQGLVSYYDAGNTKSYPDSGNTWFDLSKNKSNSFLNGPEFTGTGFTFDGNLDTCRTTLPVSTLERTFTLCIWFTLDSTQSSDTTSISKRLVSADSSVVGTKWRLGTTPSRELRFGGSGGNERPSGAILDLGKVYFAAVTHNISNTYSLFLNSTNIVRDDTSRIAATSGRNVSIGCRPTTEDRKWTGSVFNASFYNRILSDEEINQNFNCLRSRFGV